MEDKHEIIHKELAAIQKCVNDHSDRKSNQKMPNVQRNKKKL